MRKLKYYVRTTRDDAWHGDVRVESGVVTQLVNLAELITEKCNDTGTCPACEGTHSRHYTDCPLYNLTEED